MVADEFYDGKPKVDLSEEELMQGLKMFAGVDMQETSDEGFLPPDIPCAEDGCERAGRYQGSLRKYLADSGLTEVVRPDSR